MGISGPAAVDRTMSNRRFTLSRSLTALALVLLSTINGQTPTAVVMIYMALLGAGVATFQSPNTSSIMGSVPRNQLGIAGGINALFRNLGMVSGTIASK